MLVGSSFSTSPTNRPSPSENQGIEFAHTALAEYQVTIGRYEHLSSILGFIRRREESADLTPDDVEGVSPRKLKARMNEIKTRKIEFLPQRSLLTVLETINDVLPPNTILWALPSGRRYKQVLDRMIHDGQQGKPIEFDNLRFFLAITKRALRSVPRAKIDAALFRRFAIEDDIPAPQAHLLGEIRSFCEQRIDECDAQVRRFYRRGMHPKTAHEKVRQMARTYFRSRAIECVAATEWGQENLRLSIGNLQRESHHAMRILNAAQILGRDYERNAEEVRLKDLVESHYTGMRWQYDILFAPQDSERYWNAQRDYGHAIERMYNTYNSYARHKRDAASLGACLFKFQKQSAQFMRAKTVEKQQLAAQELLLTVQQMSDMWDHTNFNLKKLMMNNLFGISEHLIQFTHAERLTKDARPIFDRHVKMIREEIRECINMTSDYLREVHHLVFPWGDMTNIDPSLINKSSLRTEFGIQQIHRRAKSRKMAYVLDFPDFRSLAPESLPIFEQTQLRRLVRKDQVGGQKALLSHVPLSDMWDAMIHNAGSFIGVINDYGKQVAGCILERQAELFSEDGKIALELAKNVPALQGAFAMFIKIVAADKGISIEAPQSGYKGGIATPLNMIFELTDAFSSRLNFREHYQTQPVAILFMVREGDTPNLASESYERCDCVKTDQVYESWEDGGDKPVPYRLWYRFSRDADLALTQVFKRIAPTPQGISNAC